MMREEITDVTHRPQRKHCFDAETYLKSFYYHCITVPNQLVFPLQCIHDVFQSLPRSLKVLDYGTGPVICYVISAAGRQSEIVLSDPAHANREALKKWLFNEPSAFDWTLYFNHVVQKLEGRSEQEARERKEILRRSVKDVAYCEIEDDHPITTKYPGLFDVIVIIETGALASAHSQDVHGFEHGVAKLAALLKPGGTLLMITLICHQNNYFTEYSYFNGKYEHSFFPVSSGYVRSVLEKQGFHDVKVKLPPIATNEDDEQPSDDQVGSLFNSKHKGFSFISATKEF